MPARIRCRPLLAGLACALAAGAPARAELPPENRCPTLSGMPGLGKAEDAAPTPLREGMVMAFEDVLRLGTLLPPEVWRTRAAFFHDGMVMEIGACHRRYPVAAFYADATRRFAGRARIDEAGNLLDHVAGLPFPPDSIDPSEKGAGSRWAWNLARRYRGAGAFGSFRIVDLPSLMGGIQVYEGEWTFVQIAHRADLPESGYAEPLAEGFSWISGGRFSEPMSARHLAWRQLRPTGADRAFETPDDTFVYVPSMRKVRRAVSTWVDGLYMPRYRVSGGDGGGGFGVPGGGGLGGALNPTSGESAQVTENLRRGFEGLSLRPNAYVWRILGEREVLAPINVTRGGYPGDEERNFGPGGLSVGGDRWDVRWAVVIQGAQRERDREFDYLTLYVDYQTQQPLYVVTRRRGARGGRALEVGILLHRFSGDLPRYPIWPDGSPANVFDPVAAVFHDSINGESGWRRESYDVVGVPPRPAEIQRLISPGYLTRGR